MKKTVIIGASTNPERYAFKAANMLVRHGHFIVPLGLKKGNIAGTEIITTKPVLNDVDTITLYLNPLNQKEWYEYIQNLNPKRVIFNPGTENEELGKILQAKSIETLEACTLVLLATGQY